MVDDLDSKTRAKNMSRIKSKDTTPELMIRRALHVKGLRYKLHDKSLPGKPDLVFPKYMALIEVNGCFWHGHSCYMFKWPKTREEYWKNKITNNIERDKRNLEKLKGDGWRILIIWECSLKGPHKLAFDVCIEYIIDWLVNGSSSTQLSSFSDIPYR